MYIDHALDFVTHLVTCPEPMFTESYSACSLVGFSQPKSASQQCFPLKKTSTSQPKPAPAPTSEQARI